MEESGLSESMALSILRMLYRLDEPLNRISDILSQLPPGTERDQLSVAVGDVVGIVLSDLMVPIYRLHPQLGRASEPGARLNE